jgi:hypothetical protein
VLQLLWISSRVRLGRTGLSYLPKETKLALVVSVSAPFSNEQGGSREALPTWPDVRKGSTTIHHVVGPMTAEVTCITAASIRVLWPYGRFP